VGGQWSAATTITAGHTHTETTHPPSKEKWRRVNYGYLTHTIVNAPGLPPPWPSNILPKIYAKS